MSWFSAKNSAENEESAAVLEPNRSEIPEDKKLLLSLLAPADGESSDLSQIFAVFVAMAEECLKLEIGVDSQRHALRQMSVSCDEIDKIYGWSRDEAKIVLRSYLASLDHERPLYLDSEYRVWLTGLTVEFTHQMLNFVRLGCALPSWLALCADNPDIKRAISHFKNAVLTAKKMIAAQTECEPKAGVRSYKWEPVVLDTLDEDEDFRKITACFIRALKDKTVSQAKIVLFCDDITLMHGPEWGREKIMAVTSKLAARLGDLCPFFAWNTAKTVALTELGAHFMFNVSRCLLTGQPHDSSFSLDLSDHDTLKKLEKLDHALAQLDSAAKISYEDEQQGTDSHRAPVMDKAKASKVMTSQKKRINKPSGYPHLTPLSPLQALIVAVVGDLWSKVGSAIHLSKETIAGMLSLSTGSSVPQHRLDYALKGLAAFGGLKVSGATVTSGNYKLVVDIGREIAKMVNEETLLDETDKPFAVTVEIVPPCDLCDEHCVASAADVAEDQVELVMDTICQAISFKRREHEARTVSVGGRVAGAVENYLKEHHSSPFWAKAVQHQSVEMADCHISVASWEKRDK